MVERSLDQKLLTSYCSRSIGSLHIRISKFSIFQRRVVTAHRADASEYGEFFFLVRQYSLKAKFGYSLTLSDFTQRGHYAHARYNIAAISGNFGVLQSAREWT
ncbi:hypothetical protein CYMTET_4644 [Cymbomonas tetramitiformis]|uniref:Uncharacterized protein n=1 Tax=Cymbomonas tetramitiformis TaxID=36881 RepID=A0AAE0LJP3_9CHLO|nr:hypothetical protein CYMTET_4644 [Cymbomonas tetramitiformis]